MIELDRAAVERIVNAALAEDIGSGDITTILTTPEGSTCSAEIVAREEGVLAGIEVAHAAFRLTDPGLRFEARMSDGDELHPGSIVATAAGPARGILTAERVALNFLQRMSGIATLTSRFVRLVEHTKARIADTRKTTPGLRLLEKYAVRAGGGHNHRFGLYDGILIKDNHVIAAGGVAGAVRAAKASAPHSMKVEVEVDSLEQLREALDAGADSILLDNMAPDMLRQAVELAGGKAMLEASGGVTLATVKAIAETGVDLISVGALTHSAPALDIALEILC